ncbi:ABC transporter ATP-binding protein [Paenibacillus sp. KN14-4R]|uniref:ABC transporter ATP-binding protein n=1 Tax=Paenibacillus sp. KN14-4R TaxID=3445773 RepID=UPI003FA0AAF5
MTDMLQITNLYGGYLPGKPILKDVTFSVKKGEMVGLIGLNGAGKSTTIKHILGLMLPQQGSVHMNGQTLAENTEVYRKSYAFVPETPELYSELTVWEHLELTAMAYNIPRDEFEKRTARLLQEFRMENKKNSLSTQLSKGMKQKVMIMNALLIEPSLYIIDEPFLGLDPLAMRSLLETMDRLRQNGASFLISSHILATIESYCDRFVILHAGQIAAQGTLEELRQEASASGGANLSNRPMSLDDLFYYYITREENRE